MAYYEMFLKHFPGWKPRESSVRIEISRAKFESETCRRRTVTSGA